MKSSSLLGPLMTLPLVYPAFQLIELNSNPEAGEKRVRATLKPFKKPHRDSDEVEAQSRIKVLLEENNRRKQKLKEVIPYSLRPSQHDNN